MTFPVRCCPVHGPRPDDRHGTCEARDENGRYCWERLIDKPAELVGEGPSREALMELWAADMELLAVMGGPNTIDQWNAGAEKRIQALARCTRESGREGEKRGD